MNQKINHLITSLNNSYDGEPWYGTSLLSILHSIDFSVVNERVNNKSNSVAKLLQHLINWRLFTIKKLEGDEGFDIILNSLDDWPEVHIASEQEWKQMLATLQGSQDKMIKLLSSKEDHFLSTQVPGKDYTFQFLIEGSIQHDIYHLGQIALVHKLLT